MAPKEYMTKIVRGEPQALFYDVYVEGKNKPMMVADSGIYFYSVVGSDILGGPSELEMKQGWWRQFLGNPNFTNAFPRIKLICLTESFVVGEGYEKGFYLDSRILADETITAKFITDLKTIQGSVEWAKDIELDSWSGTVGLPLPNSDQGGTFSSVTTVIIISIVPSILVIFCIWAAFAFVTHRKHAEFHGDDGDISCKGWGEVDVADDSSTVLGFPDTTDSERTTSGEEMVVVAGEEDSRDYIGVLIARFAK
jgi:hypothetical protein